MENASKALLIAGAILIVILLISLGIYIYSQAQQTINSVNMDEQQITAFNNKFAQYEGEDKSGSEVSAMIDLVISSNQAAYAEGAKEKYITVSGTSGAGVTAPTASGDYTPTVAKVKTGKTYDVTFTYQAGLIHSIAVDE